MLASASSIVLKNTGLQFTRRPSLHSWEALGKQLFAVADSSTWWIADWLVFGESTFLDRYEEAIKKTQLNYQTLRNYAWVARSFDIPRRREKLTFGHHAEVAALDQPEQDYWLRKAEECGWSCSRLRSEVRGSWRERQDSAAPPKGQDRAAERQDRAAERQDRAAERQDRAALPRGHTNPTPADTGMRMTIKSPARKTLELQLTPEQVELFNSLAEGEHLSLRDWAIGVLNSMAGYQEEELQ